jgi:hypothetical protein
MFADLVVERTCVPPRRFLFSRRFVSAFSIETIDRHLPEGGLALGRQRS